MKHRRLICMLLISALLLLTGAVFAACTTVTTATVTLVTDAVQTDGDIVVDFVNLAGKRFSMPAAASEKTVSTTLPLGTHDIKLTVFGAEVLLKRTVKEGDTAVKLSLFGETLSLAGLPSYYQISTPEQFKNIAHLSGAKKTVYYYLASTIDLAGQSVDLGVFTGVMTGTNPDGKSTVRSAVQNLTLAGNDSVGLMKENAGVVRDIDFRAISVSGNNKVGTVTPLNKGVIENCEIKTGSIEGQNFVGGFCGEDYGYISNCTVASAVTVTGADYFGTVAGVSYSNIHLGAYGDVPTQIPASTIPLTEGMSDNERLKTAMQNWINLEDRAKLVSADISLDFTSIVNFAIDALINSSAVNSMVKSVADKISKDYKMFTLAMHGEAKMMYNGAKNGVIDEFLMFGGAYLPGKTPQNNDSTLISVLTNGLLYTGLVALFDFDPNELFDNGVAGAVYYNRSENHYFQLSGAGPDNTYIDTIRRRVLASYSEPVYHADLQDDLRAQMEALQVAEEYIQLAFSLIDDLLAEIYTGSVVDWLNPDFLVPTGSTVTGEVREMRFTTVDGVFDGLVATVNALLADIETLLGQEGYFPGAIGTGTRIELEYNMMPEVVAEVFSNGYMRSLTVDNFDISLKLVLSPTLVKTITDYAEENGYTLNFDTVNNTFRVGAKTIYPISEQFSYAKSDTDIGLYLKAFQGEKQNLVTAVEALLAKWQGEIAGSP